ncbi:MAG: hypothetical protein IT431_17085 [Phycisphaerales bacterium]|nr:hypothetical protein [Phycisphaerales bacterium]
MTATPLVLATLALAATASRAQPDLLWDNGEYDTWDHGKLISSERNTIVPDSWIFDDFTLLEPASLRRLEWLAGKREDLDPVGADFILLSSGFGPIDEYFDHEYTSEFKGTAYGLPVHLLTIAGLDIELAPGRYFIGARFVGSGSERAFAAGQYRVLGETEAYIKSDYFGYPDWTQTGYRVDAVFQVYGDIIPAPPTLALTALAHLALRRRR